MASMNIFDNDAFGVVSLTTAFEDVEYNPQYLGKYFKEVTLSTDSVTVESKSNKLTLIPTSEVGSPIDQATGTKRELRNFRPIRLAKGDVVNANEVSMIRAFGKDSELKSVQKEVAERVSNLNSDLDLTMEAMRLGAVQGKFIDVATGTVIYDWFDEFNVTKPAEINFELTTDDTDVLKKCKDMRRAILKECKGAVTQQTKIIGLVDSEFWDALVSHPNVKQYYLNWAAAQNLKELNSSIYDEFNYGGITFVEYRGTDDNTTVAIGTDKAVFFPTNVKDNLVVAYTPTPEMMDFVNQKARKVYTILDKDPSQKKAWVKPEIYSYPLIYCARPKALRRGKKA